MSTSSCILFCISAYFKSVADKTREDRHAHKESDLFTEHVRLTDERTLRAQTDEDGDLFNWLKHQAQKGTLSAKVSANQFRMHEKSYWL